MKLHFTKPMLVATAAVIVGVLTVLLANAHLVYVAVTSEPDCVVHIKPSEAPAARGSFSAAKSAC
ncbi:MAG: hypothetical protein WA943_11645 [Parvibaculum sp.]|uniref:hypothetical protein n=1 Tax=Parvibaculum sp. TaxID=2024848 RepID=UPI003C74F7D2